MNLRLDSFWLAPSARSILTSIFAKLRADLEVVSVPMRAVDIIYTDGREFVESVLVFFLRLSLWTDCARSQEHCFVHVVLKETFLQMSHCIDHLDSTLRPAKVEDFFSSCCIPHCSDVRSVVVESHFSPRICPELRIVGGQRFVLLRILSSSIVANPDIVASGSKEQMHRRSSVEITEPI